MQRTLLALVLAACIGVPLAASAQSAPPPASDAPGPPPAMHAKMDAIAAQAKSDGYAALSPDHRAKVTAIVAKVTAGALDPRAAGEAIDAVLSPDERTAVLAVAAKTRAQMRATFAGAMPPPPPPADGTAPVPAPPAEGGGHRQMTAGGFLMRVSLTPQQMRALRGDRPAGPPPPP
jgi:hypothetical protein